MIGIEISWAAAHTLDGKPALSVLSRIEKDGLFVDKVQHVIPIDALESFNPPLSIFQLIEVACEPAAIAQKRTADRLSAAAAKRARKLDRARCIRDGRPIMIPLTREEWCERLDRMAGVLH